MWRQGQIQLDLLVQGIFSFTCGLWKTDLSLLSILQFEHISGTMLENKSCSFVAFGVIFYELWNNIDILADKQTCMQWWKMYFNFTDLISQCWWSRMNHNLLSEHTCDKPYLTAPFRFLIITISVLHIICYSFLISLVLRISVSILNSISSVIFLPFCWMTCWYH